MEETKDFTEKLESVYKTIEPQLKAGVTYYSVPFVTDFGTSGGMIFTIEEGERIYAKRDEFERLDLYDISTSFPPNSFVKYTIRKGNPITVERCTPQMLIEEMNLTIQSDAKRNGYTEVETHVKFLRKKKMQMDVVEKRQEEDGSVYETDYSSFDDELEALYAILDGKLEKLHALYKDGKLTVTTTPAIPGLTEELVEQQEDLELDASNLGAIYAFMESCSDAKIGKALKTLKSNPGMYAKAEKRYLNLVRARLNDATASLDRFPEATLTKAEVNTLTGRNFDKDFISLSYFDEAKSKLTVDFIGSMIRNVIDTESYIAQAAELNTESELKALYDTFAANAKTAILAEAEIHPEGWYAKISSHLINLKLERLLFEKTQFDDANRSLVLKDFIFFLNINYPYSIYMDIFQSDEPKLTEMFWLLRSVPDTAWGDMEPNLPDSPLKFERCGSVRIGDGGKWEEVCKLKN